MTRVEKARRVIWTANEQNAHFSLFPNKHKDLYDLYKRNLVGGPSIIYHRYGAAGETNIRNDPNFPCGKILGYDANSLYLWALSQNMCTGDFLRRSVDNHFKPVTGNGTSLMFDWLEFLNYKGANIQHKQHGGEKRFGPYLVDGWDPSTHIIYEFNGCYFHGHTCFLTKFCKDRKLLEERLERTRKRVEFLKSLGINVVEKWECQFKNECKTNRELKTFCSMRKPKFYQKNPNSVSETQILDGVRDGTLFGSVLVDIEVPEKDYEKWSEFSPLFCSVNVPYEAIGKTMQDYWERTQKSPNGQTRAFPKKRLLVGGMKAEKLLLSTDLLQWYLTHGLQVTKVHEVIEYTPMKCFKKFTEDVSDARRDGDRLESQEVIGNLMKLIGNSAYGGVIMDKTRHTSVKYVKGDVLLAQKVNSNLFRNSTNIKEDYHEIELAKAIIRLDLPIQIGFQILQLAKLQMLRFYYEFLVKFIPLERFQLLEMDTDSFYISIAGESLRDVIKPDLRNEYDAMSRENCRDDISFEKLWFPRSCCQKHKAFDKRQPGLFKVEYEGEKMISLCSKSYIVTNGKDYKMSCKGVNKSRVTDAFAKFEKALKERTTVSVSNMGFRPKNHTMYTYEQNKIGFNYFYCKRNVLDDHVSTKPLELVLSPEPVEKCLMCQYFTTYFTKTENGSVFCENCKAYLVQTVINYCPVCKEENEEGSVCEKCTNSVGKCEICTEIAYDKSVCVSCESCISEEMFNVCVVCGENCTEEICYECKLVAVM